MASVSEEPMVLPPVVPSIKTIIETSISQVENLQVHSFEHNLFRLECPRESLSLRRAHPTQLPLSLQLLRDPGTGARKKTVLVENSILQETSKTSYSLTRAPAARHESVKGSSTNLPFMPGGLEDKDGKSGNIRRPSLASDWVDNEEEEAQLFAELFDNNRLVDLPNKAGINFKESISGNGSKQNTAVNGTGLPVGHTFDFWQGQDKNEVKVDRRLANKQMRKERSLNHLLKEFKDAPEIPLPMDDDVESKPPVLAISKAPTVTTFQTKMQWSEAVDISKPMDDFEERVPDMAFKYKFELDTFQKQAIVRLEEHENVFVAAHTSAGKTVVAEYAIALSSRHMTRTIYTSPIKALSNQKFRDFKKDFESVGLVTGDVQINQNASCLIMTTEILRSMLYNGSDVIRDLEWVVFDEIHYLNNEERGHVWEEVLIMLPQHVSIIMLSATVPNALQFANWVGGIKKKKIHVISTSKRPVPLEHHLYTGSGGKSRKEQFLVLGAEGRFLKQGYDSAKEAITERMSKHAKEFGAKTPRSSQFNPAAEKNTYIGLVNHLKESEKLPVVIFTFSRNRCDNYAEMLSSVDLCTGAEKGKIHGFFQQSISKLKGTDRDLPQVVAFQRMLKNGIGVHHSGILPILKEVVEMLFQMGLVKLLFATETFAMGVNMPARTVVFDSIRKHDGTQFRSLNPAEYIQMAGRAGRRGLDTTGTVIILCKQHVPDLNDINYMMLGSAAKLESQFRLTYSMILNLLRVESITVEDVMKRSFLEAGKFVKVDEVKEKRAAIHEKLLALEFTERDEKLCDFYTEMKQYFALRYFLMDKIVIMPKVMENMKPGRIVLVEDLPRYSVRFGILLNSRAVKEVSGLEKRFKVLILTGLSSNIPKDDLKLSESEVKLMDAAAVADVNRLYHLMLYYSHTRLLDFEPELNPQGFPPHKVIEVRSYQILELIEDGIRVDVDVITSDISRREMARFRDSKPVPNLLRNVEYLFDLHSDENIGRRPVKIMNMLLMTPFKDPGIMESLNAFSNMKKELKQTELFDARNPAKLEEFADAFRYQRLVDERSNLDFALSPKSLQLHEEYQQRINVLKAMEYIDNDNLVQLKGRVACEMGNQHELMMTELLLNNTLSDCEPEEIAALLSCMVFEANRIDEPELPQEAAHLTEKIKQVKELARTIGMTQREHNLKEPVEQFVEQFKFGLVEVVYEWAKGKPFYEIMRLTEVQEGLIVRTIQRLDEMIRDVKDASRIIGDPSLRKKMEEASQCIKRDIVFAASLYTQ